MTIFQKIRVEQLISKQSPFHRGVLQDIMHVMLVNSLKTINSKIPTHTYFKTKFMFVIIIQKEPGALVEHPPKIPSEQQKHELNWEIIRNLLVNKQKTMVLTQKTLVEKAGRVHHRKNYFIFTLLFKILLIYSSTY